MLTALKENKIFLGILLVIFFVYLWMAWQPIESLLSHFLVDDAFYYFKTASNIANGLGPTFDGEHLTNGYHPLWMGISVLIYYFFPDDKLSPLHLILSLAVLLFIGTALLLWRIISRIVSDRIARATLVFLFALNPWNLNNFLDGLETPLAIFLLISLFWLFLKILDGKDNIQNFILLGIVSGLMILARLDYGLFPAVIFLFFLIKKRISWKSLSAFLLPAFLLAAPWFLYNYVHFGSPIPDSGLSYTLINHRLWFYKDRSLFQILLWSLYNFFGTIAFTLKTIGLPNFYSASNFWKSLFSLSAIFMPLVAATGYFYIVKRKQFQEYMSSIISSKEWSGFLVFFIGYLGLVIGHGAIRWSGREWYFASFPLLAVILAALFLSRPLVSIYQKKALLVIAGFLIFSFSLFPGTIFTQNINQLEMYNAAVWVKNYLPANVRVAAFNSGILGYFSDRFVMNSDGLINTDAYEALKGGRLWEFFKKEQIDYIIDYDITLTYRFRPFLGINNPLSEVVRADIPSDTILSGSYGGSHISAFKLNYEKF